MMNRTLQNGQSAEPKNGSGTGAVDSKMIVVKYGGSVMSSRKLEEQFASEIRALIRSGHRIAIVHGGGSEITGFAERLGIETHFVGGHRYTGPDMMDLVVMTLAGKINKQLVRLLSGAGLRSVGMCGVDGEILKAEPLKSEHGDLGQVGRVVDVDPSVPKLMIEGGIVPVIAPVALGVDGRFYNVNADLAATAIAVALHADLLLFMSDIDGVRIAGEVVPTLTAEEARGAIADGEITGGMIPKIDAAIDAVSAGVGGVQIINGRYPELLANVIGGEGIGTRIVASGAVGQTVPVEEFEEQLLTM